MIERCRRFLTGETTPHLLKTFGMYALIALSIIGTKVLVARFYGQEELGQFSYFFSLVTVAFLFTSFGLPEAITQIVVKNHNLLRPAVKKALFWIVLSSIVTSFLILTIPFILDDTTNKINFALYIATYTFFYGGYCIFRAYKRFVEGTWYSLINRVVFMGVIVVGGAASLGFNFILTGLSIALLTASIVSLPALIKLWKGEDDKFAQDGKVISSQEILSLAFSLMLMQAGFYLLRETDILIIPHLVNFTELGLYSAHSSLSNIIRLVAYVFPVVVLPMAVVSKYKLRQSLGKIVLMLVPFSLLVLGATYLFVPLLYGKEYTNYLLPAALVISSALMVLYSYLNSILVGENSVSKKYLKIIGVDFLITLMMNTSLTIYLVMEWGIIGAPIATALTVAVKIGYNGYWIRTMRMEKINPSDVSSPPSQDHKSQ